MPGGILCASGIGAIPGVWSGDSVRALNEALDEPFRVRANERRAYVNVDELAEAGVLEHVFPTGLRALLPELMTDPVLYHCHAYEISSAETKPHIHGSLLDGWHRDVETRAGHVPDAARYVSVFVYLCEVGPEDGPFELLPSDPEQGFAPGLPCVSVTGPEGCAFAWNRSFYHRAAPNRSPRRRRVLKLSVQPRSLPNDRIRTAEFVRASAHPAVETLGLGPMFGREGAAVAPAVPVPKLVPIPATGGVDVGRIAIATHRVVALARPSIR
ncbi:MAG: phytanoyl-CoA dioxygenase family protein [Acidimicrobiia bacterium]